MGGAAVPIAVAIGALSTGYQIASSEKARNAAMSQAKNQNKLIETQLNDQAEETALYEKEQAEQSAALLSEKEREAKRSRSQKLKNEPKSGRAGTILTSPLGIVNGQETERKSLLGT